MPGQPPLPIQPGREEEAERLLAESGAADASVEMVGVELASTPGLATPGDDSDDASEVDSPADVTFDAPEAKDIESPTRRLRVRAANA